MTQRGVLSPFISGLAVGASVPIGTRGLVHVWGRNDMSSAQRMGIGWTVTDPDGIIVDSYGTWEAWPYSPPGEAHPFTGGRFDIKKTGDYMIVIELRMNEPDPVVVDSYVGVLCRVTEEYAGTIIKKELEYDSVRGDIPVY